MAEPNSPSQSDLATTDFWRSVFFGPLRIIVPAFAALFLYRVVFQESGLSVLGLWSLILAVSSYLLMADVGFSQLLIREIPRGAVTSPFLGAYQNFVVAQFAYLLVSLVAAPLLAFVAFVWQQDAYESSALAASVAVLVISIGIQLIARLYGSVLAANQDYAFYQLVLSFSPLLMLLIGFFGATNRVPIEGLAVGHLCSSVALLMILKLRCRRRYTGWDKVVGRRLFRMRPILRLRMMVSRGLHFYNMAVGSMVRDPIYRGLITSIVGLEALGIYAIGAKVSSAAREVIASGYAALYPSVNTLLRAGNRAAVVRLMRKGMVVLYALGGASLLVVFLTAEFFLDIWLGSSTFEMIAVTRVLLVWCFITLLNVPFHYFLMAAGDEKVLSIAVWVHVLLILFVWPLSFFMPMSVVDLAIYWTITSVFTQGIIFYTMHAKHGLLLPVFTNSWRP